MKLYPALLTLPAAALVAWSAPRSIPLAREVQTIQPTTPSLTRPASRVLDDPTIVAIFDAANTADIQTGKLAAERASNQKVREFGAMLVRDHEHVRQLGRDLAKKLGVTPTPPTDDTAARDHAKVMATLRAARGSAFDRAFLQHEAAFHKSVIDAIQMTLLPAIENEELKALIVKVAPAFQAHMLAAQKLERDLAPRY